MKDRTKAPASPPSLPQVPSEMDLPTLRGLVSQLVEVVHQLQARLEQLQTRVDRLEQEPPRKAAPLTRARRTMRRGR